MLGEGDGRKVKEVGERKEEINPRRWEFFSYQEVFARPTLTISDIASR